MGASARLLLGRADLAVAESDHREPRAEGPRRGAPGPAGQPAKRRGEGHGLLRSFVAVEGAELWEEASEGPPPKTLSPHLTCQELHLLPPS